MYRKVGSRSHYIHIATNFITTFSRPYIQQSRASRSFDSVNQILCYITTIGANTKTSPALLRLLLPSLGYLWQGPERQITKTPVSCSQSLITGANYEMRSTDILNQLQWPTLDSRRSRAKLILMYKILNNRCAPLLRNLFLKVSDCDKKYDLRNTNTDQALPKPRTNFLKCSFQYGGATLCNSLKGEAKIAKSLGEFRRKINVPDAVLC